MYKGTQTTTHCQQTNSKQDCLKIKSPKEKGVNPKKKKKNERILDKLLYYNVKIEASM